MSTDSLKYHEPQKYRYSQFHRKRQSKNNIQAQQYRPIRTRTSKFKQHQHSSKIFIKTKRNSEHFDHNSCQSLRVDLRQNNKKQFAQQYTRITSQFKNLLLMKNKNSRYFSENRKQVRCQELAVQQFTPKNKSSFSASQYKLQYFKSRNNKLDKLFSNRTEQSSALLLTASKDLYPMANKQIYIHLEQQKKLKINDNFKYLPEFLAHFNNLFVIRELLQDYHNNYQLIIRKVKNYVLNYQGADITKLQDLLKIQKQKEKIKIFLCLQKIVIIGVLDSLVRQKFIQHQVKIVMDSLIGVYYSILQFVQKDKVGKDYQQKINNVTKLLQSLQLHKRKDLKSTIDFLLRKIPLFYRFNQNLFAKVKEIIAQTKHQKFKINRIFYQLLTEYAINLNKGCDILINNRNLLDTFATCPAPHLSFRRTKGNITVLFQFQNTLAFVKGNSRHKFKIRPYATQILKQLCKICQVIIITTLLPDSLPKQNDLFSFAEIILYKYHCTRYRGSLLKDISRLGRKLQQMIIIDSESKNIVHKNNLYQIQAWRGNLHDVQLLRTFQYLQQLVSSNPSDIRQYLNKPKIQHQADTLLLQPQVEQVCKHQLQQLTKNIRESLDIKDLNCVNRNMNVDCETEKFKENSESYGTRKQAQILCKTNEQINLNSIS